MQRCSVPANQTARTATLCSCALVKRARNVVHVKPRMQPTRRHAACRRCIPVNLPKMHPADLQPIVQ